MISNDIDVLKTVRPHFDSHRTNERVLGTCYSRANHKYKQKHYWMALLNQAVYFRPEGQFVIQRNGINPDKPESSSIK